MSEMKTCVICKNMKPAELFQRIIKQQTYGIGCDEDGYVQA
jgi:predicted RNA-binding protein YlxR (DUF448 family)